MKKKTLWIMGLLIVFIALSFALLGGSSQGVRYLFQDKQFHYQAFRTLGHALYGGALPGEVMALVSRIHDDESWKREWTAMAEQCEIMASTADDQVSKGNALLRASNYYRAAEFFIEPAGEGLAARRELYHKSVRAFREALIYLKIPHRIYQVKDANSAMTVYYFPGKPGKPAVFIHGGYDSTNEESYFFVGAPLVERGYPVIMFDGPGQSGMIRNYNIKFTPHWHEPLGRVMDFIISEEPDLIGKKKVLVGISMGGILAGRAAAYEKRIDGAILFGSPYDMEDAALFQMPSVGRWLYSNGYRESLNTVVGMKSKWDRGVRWGVNNGLWTIGGKNPYEMVQKMGAYTLEDVQDKVWCHVLCMYGENDIYVSDANQMKLFKDSFRNAASYTFKVFSEKDGSAEHCQIGSTEQTAKAIVSWLKKCGLDD